MMRATLTGGPFDGQALTLAAPYVPNVLYLVLVAGQPTVVGTDLIPAPEFPSVAIYFLSDGDLTLDHGAVQGRGAYAYVPPGGNDGSVEPKLV